MGDKSDKELLEDFIHENYELEKLEGIIDEFNIFTALQIVNVEVRHSNFLSWLMNPYESHGLGTYFITSFLKRIVFNTPSDNATAPSIFDVDSWSFEDIEVLREWKNIDILIRNDRLRFVCAIENKVLSSEHSDQLKRYKDIVEREYPDYKKLFIYLTVEGIQPTESDYTPASYGDIVQLIERLINSKRDKLSAEVIAFISHYKEMLRRYIVEDSEIHKLCESIYKKHRRALDLIFEYRPDKLLDISNNLVNIVGNDPDLILDSSTKTMVRFIPKSLDFIPKEASGWTKSNRILLFELKNNVDGVGLSLIIGRGNDDIRKKLHDIVQQDLGLFKPAKYSLYPQWHTIFKKVILTKKDYEEKETDEIRELLEERMAKFKELDLPKIESIIKTFDH